MGAELRLEVMGFSVDIFSVTSNKVCNLLVTLSPFDKLRVNCEGSRLAISIREEGECRDSSTPLRSTQNDMVYCLSGAVFGVSKL